MESWGWTDGWMDGWMDGWVDGWMDVKGGCYPIQTAKQKTQAPTAKQESASPSTPPPHTQTHLKRPKRPLLDLCPVV